MKPVINIIRYLTIISFLGNIIACSEKGDSKNANDFAPFKYPDEDTILTRLYEKHKDKIHDFVCISADTLLAAKWTGNVIRSCDGGKTWTEFDTPKINWLTVDKNKRVWGINSWRGIHEDDRAALFYSDDLGETWTDIRLHPAIFFPLYFRNEASEKPRLITANDNSLYEYQAGPPGMRSSWKFIKQYYENEDRISIDSDRLYRIVNDTILEKSDGSGSVWKEILNLNITGRSYFRPYIKDILQVQNKIYLAGYEGADPLLYEITNDKIVRSFEIDTEEVRGIRKDIKGRIWAFGSDGIFLRQGNKFIRMK